MDLKLYDFFRSGTSHRLRIALNLKGLSYARAAIDLTVTWDSIAGALRGAALGRGS